MKNLELLEKRVAKLEAELTKLKDILKAQDILELEKGDYPDGGPKKTPKKT